MQHLAGPVRKKSVCSPRAFSKNILDIASQTKPAVGLQSDSNAEVLHNCKMEGGQNRVLRNMKKTHRL